MKVKYRIITNNASAEAKYPRVTEFLETGADGVLIRTRDCIHKGAKLLNHPLSGGVLPGVRPYISLVITDNDNDNSKAPDMVSLELIENAIRLFKKAPAGFIGYDENTLDDFKVIDLDLLDSAIVSIA